MSTSIEARWVQVAHESGHMFSEAELTVSRAKADTIVVTVDDKHADMEMMRISKAEALDVVKWITEHFKETA